MPRPSHDNATLEGPLRLLVASGLAYMVWRLATQSQPTAEAPLPPAIENATLLNQPS